MEPDDIQDAMQLNISNEPSTFRRKKTGNKVEKFTENVGNRGNFHNRKKGSLLLKEGSPSSQNITGNGNPDDLPKKLHSNVPRARGFNKTAVTNRTQIASLFNCNPEVPHIAKCSKEQRKEHLFTDDEFSKLDLHPHLVSGLESRFNATKMTEVQRNAIPLLLDGKDVLVKSCTGSGKTLAYAVPIVQKLQAMIPKIQRSDGTYALIVLPTRELALQSYECFSKLTNAFTRIVPGYLIGGEKKKSEKARIRKGINILVSTPGRLLDHLDHTATLDFHKICWLVIDEADRLFEEGFQESAMKIIRRVKEDISDSNLQTVLLSATLSKGVEKLAGMSLVDPVCVDIASKSFHSEEMTDLVIPEQLKQYLVVTPTKLRLVTLSAFIVDKCSEGNMKMLIFLCAQNNVDFHFILFNFILKPMLKFKGHKVKFFKLHGNMKQEDRTEVFGRFKTAKNGILLCTDVAARGLHLPEVDWIVQYSAPVSPENYVHRVGRTARIGNQGHSLIFLIPSEIEFVSLLQKYKIFLEEMDMGNVLSSLNVIGDVIYQESGKQRDYPRNVEEQSSALQFKYENSIYSEDTHHTCAKEAFLTFVQAYSSYPKNMRPVIPFKMLHLGHVAKSFCLRESPSQLGCRFADKRSLPFRNQRADRPAREKRPMPIVSEFDSGLSQWKGDLSRVKKKRKLH